MALRLRSGCGRGEARTVRGAGEPPAVLLLRTPRRRPLPAVPVPRDASQPLADAEDLRLAGPQRAAGPASRGAPCGVVAVVLPPPGPARGIPRTARFLPVTRTRPRNHVRPYHPD